ncbi:larval cuticle protein LCP-30-like [Penaeus indicus]|uniref:larval cuticle protein LCP-30-like n=1 Tax=Penaeus indicus TaxID=29960 RepID=UPI00300D6FE9
MALRSEESQVILACVAAVAVAAPQYAYQTPAPTYLVPAASSHDESAEVIEFIPILRDDRVHEDDGRYNLDVETANGISMSQSGSPDGPDGAIVKAGQYSYTAPDGSLIEIKFVANENGFQPQGAHLPVILACVAAVAVAAPQYAYETPAPTYLVPAASSRDESAEVIEFIPILRDDRVHEDDGRYNLDVETANGISMSQSGSPDGPDGAIVKAGQYSYTAPDGSLIEIKFVANENGFQPQGAHLPVAPEFPHPIPQFVLDQIAFAAEENAARERAEAQASAPAPTRLYGQPQ